MVEVVTKFYVEDSYAGNVGTFDTLAEALEQANAELSEYRKRAWEGWGLDQSDLCVYQSEVDADDVSEGTLLARNVECNIQ